MAAAVLLLAGCGGGGGADKEPSQVVRGTGYRFEAPAGWKVVRAGTQVQAAEGGNSPSLVSVSRFPLLKKAEEQLTDKVIEELDGIADGVADQQHGRMLVEKTVDVAGRQGRRYDIAYRRSTQLVERLVFVLRGKTEYLLLCRYEQDGDTGPCDRFVDSFTLT